MSDAIISRRSGNKSNSSSNMQFVTDWILRNTSWTVPNAKNQLFSVRIFGGGAGSSNSWSGGSGWMNNADLTLTEGEVISIRIGTGGTSSSNSQLVTAGGTTTFGTYLSANGGSRANGGSG